MIDLAVGLATVLFGTAITYIVYVYRPKIGYEILSASDNFEVHAEEISHHSDGHKRTIEIGIIKLTNSTRSDVEDFEIVFEGQWPKTNLSVKKSSTLAKEAVKFECSPNFIRFVIKRFPMKEEIEIAYSMIGRGSLEYNSPRKTHGKFELYSLRLQRAGTKGLLTGLFYGLLVPLLAGLLGYLTVSIIINA